VPFSALYDTRFSVSFGEKRYRKLPQHLFAPIINAKLPKGFVEKGERYG
jgi:hypothetical protein